MSSPSSYHQSFSFKRSQERAESTSSGLVTNPSLPPLPENRTILGFGGVCVDFLAVVREFPKPDTKIRARSSKVEGGGNAANALTCTARLGLRPRFITKVANDAIGKTLLEELEADGVDTSYTVVSDTGNSPFTYVIVDSQTKTRTCIFTPGDPQMVPDDLHMSRLGTAMEGARLVYFDGRLPDTAAIVAKEASLRGLPILLDAEKPREGLNDLLDLADYVVCSGQFPQMWTAIPSIPNALVYMLLKLPRAKFVIATLGKSGCVMLERRGLHENSDMEEEDVDQLLQSLEASIDIHQAIPTSFASKHMNLRADGIGSVCGRLLRGTSEVIPPSELVDTTGAGDAFIGAVIYAICAEMSAEKMLPFAAQVAAAKCRVLGARSGLPLRSDTRLAPYL